MQAYALSQFLTFDFETQSRQVVQAVLELGTLLSQPPE